MPRLDFANFSGSSSSLASSSCKESFQSFQSMQRTMSSRPCSNIIFHLYLAQKHVHRLNICYRFIHKYFYLQDCCQPFLHAPKLVHRLHRHHCQGSISSEDNHTFFIWDTLKITGYKHRKYFSTTAKDWISLPLTINSDHIPGGDNMQSKQSVLREFEGAWLNTTQFAVFISSVFLRCTWRWTTAVCPWWMVR